MIDTKQGQELLLVLGNKIRSRRIEKELSVSILAQRCGMEEAVLQQIENGEVDVLLDTLCKLAKALDFPVSGLIGHTAL